MTVACKHNSPTSVLYGQALPLIFGPLTSAVHYPSPRFLCLLILALTMRTQTPGPSCFNASLHLYTSSSCVALICLSLCQRPPDYAVRHLHKHKKTGKEGCGEKWYSDFDEVALIDHTAKNKYTNRLHPQPYWFPMDHTTKQTNPVKEGKRG